MAGTCPHCGTSLSESPNQHCPKCGPESPAPDQPTQSAPAGQDAERVAAFWKTLTALTPRVYVVHALIAINVAVFALMVASGVSAANPTIPQLIAWGANFGPSVFGGEWWRLLTCTFVHIGIVHIALNMWALAVSGPLVARMVGNTGFLLLYLIAGLGGSLASLLWNPEIVSAGASGAVFGVFGGLLGILQQQRGVVPPAALARLRNSNLSFLGYNLFFGLTQPNIDMAAHIGGLAVGFLCGRILSRPFTPEGAAARPVRNVLTGWLGVVFVVTGALGVSVWHAGTVEAQTELERFETTTSKLLGTYDMAVEKSRRGELTHAEVTDVLERDVLPAWRAARDRLVALNNVPSDLKPHIRAAIDYMRLTQEGWELYVQAVREGDDMKAQRSEEKMRLADKVFKKLDK